MVPSLTPAADLTLHNAPARLFFSPSGGATQAIAKEIDNATLEILVQAYSFTSVPIAKALVDAHRGVSMEVILDKSQMTASYTGATFWPITGSPSTSMQLARSRTTR